MGKRYWAGLIGDGTVEVTRGGSGASGVRTWAQTKDHRVTLRVYTRVRGRPNPLWPQRVQSFKEDCYELVERNFATGEERVLKRGVIGKDGLFDV